MCLSKANTGVLCLSRPEMSFDLLCTAMTTTFVINFCSDVDVIIRYYIYIARLLPHHHYVLTN